MHILSNTLFLTIDLLSSLLERALVSFLLPPPPSRKVNSPFLSDARSEWQIPRGPKAAMMTRDRTCRSDGTVEAIKM